MSYLDHITAFLFDENRRLSSKAAVVFFIVLSILFIDNVLGFSYSFTIDKKIEQVEKLNRVIKDPSTDSITKQFALSIRKDIIGRQNILNQTLSFFRGKSNNSIKHQANIPTDSANAKEVAIKNNFLFHSTAGGLWYLLAIVMLPVMIFTDKKTSLPQRVSTGIFAGLILFGFGWFFYWLCTFVPQLSSTTWVWNYIVNFLIQALLIFLLVVAGQKKK